MKPLMLAVLALSLAAQTRIASPAWVSGTGAAVAINATEQARWVTVLALPTNSATHCTTTDLSLCPVVGDSSIVQGSHGIPLLPGASYTYQVLPTGQPGYSLAQIFVAASVGDKVAITWAK